MNTDMNRRSFLQLASALGMSAALPVTLLEEVAEAAEEVVEEIPPSSRGLFVFQNNRWMKIGNLRSVELKSYVDYVEFSTLGSKKKQKVAGIENKELSAELEFSDECELVDFSKNHLEMKMKAIYFDYELDFNCVVFSDMVVDGVSDLPIRQMEFGLTGPSYLIYRER